MDKDEDALLAWSKAWAEALQKRYPDGWRDLCGRAGAGLRQLLDSDADLDEAAYSCSNGLLNVFRPHARRLKDTGLRLMQDAVEPLEAMGRP